MIPEELEQLLRQQRTNKSSLEILINGKSVQINSELPKEINTFSVTSDYSIKLIQPQQIQLVKSWFNEVLDRFIGDYATYNNVHIRKEDLRKV